MESWQKLVIFSYCCSLWVAQLVVRLVDALQHVHEDFRVEGLGLNLQQRMRRHAEKFELVKSTGQKYFSNNLLTLL